MNKMRWKKAAALLMASVMMVSMVACGKKDKSSSGSKEKKENKKEMTYEESDISVDGVEGDVMSSIVDGDRLYFYTSKWVEGDSADGSDDSSSEDAAEDASEEETTAEDTEEASSEEETTAEDTEEATEEDTSSEDSEETTEEDTSGDEEDSDNSEDVVEGKSYYYLYSMKTDGTDLQDLGELQVDYNDYINYMLVKNDGSIEFVLGSYDDKSQKSSYALVSYDESGKEASREDVTDLVGITDENYLSKVLVDSEDHYIFATDQSIVVLDKDLKKVCEMKPEGNYVESIAMTKDGQIIVGNSSGEDGAKVQVLDVDNQKWGDSYKINISYFSGSDALINGIEYDFYYKDDNGIYGYDLASKKGTKLMDFVASNISSDYSYSIVPIAKDMMMGTVYEDNGSRMVFYTKVDPSSITDKETITIGAMYMDDNLKTAAIDFNKKSKKYQIEFKDYSNEEDPLTKMNTDIVAGNVPDIISLSNLPIDQYIEKGLLEDLNPYFEKDSDVSVDDLIPSIAKATETEDGKRYYISPGFYVNTMVASSKVVGTESGWTIDDLKKVLDENPDARPFYSDNKNDNLNNFIASNINDYVDWTTGECSFDSQEFKDILEISNRGKSEEFEWSEDGPSEPSLVKEGKVLLENAGGMDMESVELYEAMFNTDITFIGYPNKDKQGSYFNFDNPLGIYSKSKVKDAAWDFIKTFLTLEYQGNRNKLWSNPTRQDAFDMLVKAKKATEKYTDELGNEVDPVDSSWGWDDDLEVKIGPLSDEQAQMYVDLVNNTTKVGEYNDEITNIITEEAKAYFAGQKSLDETAEIIQNRVKTYVNENR